MQRAASLIALLVGLASLALAVPAGSTNQSVISTRANTFAPAVVAVRPGETVSVRNAGGIHNVAWDDGGAPPTPSPPNSSPWTAARTFGAAGVYRYYCQVHGTPGVRGQAGIVYVNPTGTVPAPVISSASALRAANGFVLRFRSTQPSAIAGTVYKRMPSGAYQLYGALAGRAQYGFNSRRILRTAAGRPISAGRYKVTLRLRSGARLSAPRTLFASVG